MYDPFATPGAVTPTAIPQHNQVMPNPIPVSANNALASIYNKHMNLMNGQFPFNFGGQGQTGPDWRQQFQQARMDWRDAHQHSAAPAWRDAMPDRRDYRMGTVPSAGF